MPWRRGQEVFSPPALIEVHGIESRQGIGWFLQIPTKQNNKNNYHVIKLGY
jgi:hypothetical protein